MHVRGIRRLRGWVLAGVLVGAAVTSQRGERAAWVVLAAQSERLEAPLRSERERSIDVLHYRIVVELDESTRSLQGSVGIRFRSMRDGLHAIELDAETFSVTSVNDAQGRSLHFTHRGGRLSIELAAGLDFGEESRLDIDYGGENIDVNPEDYGMSEGYDLGIDFKSANERHPALINTLSFPEGARHWFPCYDHPNDRATQEVLATVRADYELLSNGRLVEVRDIDGSKRLWHWLQEKPHPTYLFVLVAGPYHVIEDEWRGIPINYWVYPRDREHAARSFHRTKDILEFFVDEYGYEFPWAKYDQITIPGIGGGAESTSATVLGESTIHDARADVDFPSHWLVAHEAAHQWWGNLISYRDWSETWLSESFATYSEYLWADHDLGPDEGAWNLHLKKQAYLTEASTRYRRPVVFSRWRYPNENFDRHTYQKGAALLNMLRWRLGDAAFRAVIRSFLTEHAYQAVGTDDLKATIKNVTGRNLDAFFDQWIYRPGHPEFEVRSDWADGKLTISVRQAQDRDDGTPVYQTPVEIGIYHRGDAVRVETVQLESVSDEFIFDVARRPGLVRFDHGNFLVKELRFAKSVGEWRFQLEYDGVIGQVQSIRALAEDGSEQARQAIIAASSEAEFWAVRREAVLGLGEIEGDFASDAVEAASRDASSRVREAALDVLGERREPRWAPQFRRLFDDDESYLVQAAAIRALGGLARAEDRGLFEEVSRMSSPRDGLARAARGALAELP